jgi:peptidoglycan hydrolase-like protein with peptidoglycan-binding domain
MELRRATIARITTKILFAFCVFLAATACTFLIDRSTVSAAPPPFLTNYQLYDRSEDVRSLQAFFNTQGFVVAQSGPGSPGQETSIFGLHTYQALKNFQSAHGLPTTGFFGPLTRALIAAFAASTTATSTAAVPQSPTAPAFSPLSSTTSGYIPGVTPLPGYKPGQLIFIGGGAPTPATPPASPPSPAPYVAKAVHFDGATTLHIASLSTTDNNTFSFVIWSKIQAPDYAGADPFFDTDPENNYTTLAGIGSSFSSQFEAYDASGSGPAIKEGVTAGTLPAAQWNVVIASVNSTTGVMKVYRGDTDITGSLGINGIPFSLVNNGLSFWFGGDPFGFDITGDISDVWIAPGQSLLDGGGDIPEATRRKFIGADGKPVDLGSDCSAPTGMAPAVCFSGDASTFGTNKGTGGAFTLTGTLTDAGTSPSN